MKTLPLQVDAHFQRFWGALAIGSALLLAGCGVVTPDRVWANGLLVAFYLVTLGLGGALFLALATITGAGWHVAFRRIPEALTRLLPVGGALLLGLLFWQRERFGWHHHGASGAGTFWFKEYWLTPTFLLTRSVVYLALWIVLARRLERTSRQGDHLPAGATASKPTAALFLFVFAISFSLASVDWIMALEPMWFSTVWGVYQFSGLVLSALATMIIAGIMLRRQGVMAGLFRDDHLHDLGKLLLGFSCFWMYIWFCQYMLIWYSNIPEETIYYSQRLHGAWGPMIVANLVLNWVLPFLVLLPRPNKRNETMMLRMAAIVLVGRWVDLSVMVFPPVVGPAPPLGIPEVAGTAAVLSITVWVFANAFATTQPAPLHDAFLGESLHYRA